VAWNYQNGDSPINGSAEVQRTVQALGAEPGQPPKIGADPENIAAALAEAQKKPHFCFSCRTLGMLVESWIYEFSGACAWGSPARS
jgi:hypothetical protein